MDRFVTEKGKEVRMERKERKEEDGKWEEGRRKRETKKGREAWLLPHKILDPPLNKGYKFVHKSYAIITHSVTDRFKRVHKRQLSGLSYTRKPSGIAISDY